MPVFSHGARQSRYKVTNWREYNESLVRRGDITFWFDEDVIDSWEHDNAEWKVGRPYVYSDLAIETLLTLRELFRLPYRQTEGLGRSLAALMGANIAIPDFTSLQKRAAKMQVQIIVTPAARQAIHVVVDSSGVKVYGEGEWKVRWHRLERRREWRKLHLAIDPQTQEIVAQVLTSSHTGDAGQVEPLLNQVQQPVEKLYGDGGYDHWNVVQHACSTADCADHLAEKERQHSPARQLRRRSLAARRKPAANPPLGSPRLETQGRLPSPQPGGNHFLANQTELRREPEKPPPGQPEDGSRSAMQIAQPFRPPRPAKIRLDQLGDKAHNDLRRCESS
jgi:Transposase DDE domain